MALNFVDRALTVVVTATLTSAVWIVAGGSLIEMADSQSQRETTRPADAAPSPAPAAVAIPAPETAGLAEPLPAEAAVIGDNTASPPDARQSRELMIPVLNIRPGDLTDTFANSPSGAAVLHEALDIMAPEGTSVVAAAPGTIEKIHTSAANGKTIYVRSADRLTIHQYAHLSEYAPGLQEGQRIRRGQRIGAVGTTGNASRQTPHLHFAIFRTTEDAAWWEPANAINPYPLLTSS